MKKTIVTPYDSEAESHLKKLLLIVLAICIILTAIGVGGLFLYNESYSFYLIVPGSLGFIFSFFPGGMLLQLSIRKSFFPKESEYVIGKDTILVKHATLVTTTFRSMKSIRSNS